MQASYKEALQLCSGSNSQVDATIIAINLVNCYRYVWVWVLGEGGVVYMQVCGCTCCAFVMCFSSKEESATFWVMNRCVQSASQ